MLISTNLGLKHYGFYRGKVLKLLSYGMCKIWIPGVYSEEFNNKEKCDNLPDAELASLMFGGCTGMNGVFSYPAIDSTVWCFFQNGDLNLPVYFAGTYGGEGIIPPTGMLRREPEANQSFPYGNILKGDPTTEHGSLIHMINSGGVSIRILEAGQCLITTNHLSNDVSSYANIFIDGVNGLVLIDASNQIIMNAREIHMNAKDVLRTKASVMDTTANSAYRLHTETFDHENNASYVASSKTNMEFVTANGYQMSKTLTGTECI